MKKATEMTQEQLFNNMKRTINTLKTTHANGQTGSHRAEIRVARFDEIKDFVTECGWWILFCQFLNIDPNCDGVDLIGGEL